MKDRPIKIVLNLSSLIFITEILESLSTTDELTNKEQFYMGYISQEIKNQLPKEEENEPK